MSTTKRVYSLGLRGKNCFVWLSSCRGVLHTCLRCCCPALTLSQPWQLSVKPSGRSGWTSGSPGPVNTSNLGKTCYFLNFFPACNSALVTSSRCSIAMYTCMHQSVCMYEPGVHACTRVCITRYRAQSGCSYPSGKFWPPPSPELC